LVLLLHSIQSLHGLTVCSLTDSPRLFLNLFEENQYPIYNLRPYRADLNWVDKNVILANSLSASVFNYFEKVKKLIR